MQKKNLKSIIKEVVDNYVNNIDDEDVRIGGMNLGLRSPLEDKED